MWLTKELIPESEFHQWNAWFQVEVPESTRSDWRMALAVTQVLNYLGQLLTGKDLGLKVEDFVLRFQDEASPRKLPTQEELEVKLKAWLVSQAPDPKPKGPPRTRKGK